LYPILTGYYSFW